MRYFRSTINEQKMNYLIRNEIPVVVFDTETTGTDADAKIIQIYAQKVIIKKTGYNSVKIERLDTLERYINPKWPLTAKIIEITNITDEMLEDKPTEDEVIEDIADFFQDNFVAAYNAAFDLEKMHYMYLRCGKEFKPKGWFDVLEMVRDYNKRMPVIPKPGERVTPYQLGNVAKNLKLDDGIDFHNASSDVEATLRILEVCANHYLQNPNINGDEILKINSVSYYDSVSKGRGFKEDRLNIGTDKGLVYYNTFYKYFASNEIDLRFVNIDQLEKDVYAMTQAKDLSKFKGRVYGY